MTELHFDPDNHAYIVNGKRVPCVSDIFRPLEHFGEINPEIIRQAARRGSLVHEYTELLDYGEPLESFEIEPEVLGYIQAYANFLRDYGSPCWVYVEKPLYSEEHGFAGTLDRYGYLDDQLTIVDIKTSSAVNRLTKILWAAKLYAYRVLIGEDARRVNLLLMKDGKYRLYDAEHTEAKYNVSSADLFSHLLAVNKLIGGYK